MPSIVKHTKGSVKLVSKCKNLYLLGFKGRVYIAWRTPLGVRYRKVNHCYITS